MCTRICLCVLCGLPAAGKSTLAQAVNSHSVQRGWRSAVISYDDLIPGDAFNVKEVEDEQDIPRSQTQTQWKCHRQTVLRGVEQFLQSPTEQLPPIIYQINSDARSRLLHAAQVCGTPTGSSQVCGTPSDRPPPPLVILLDDNFYYPSMRYEVYQLARKHSVGFCQVYVHCPVESCVKRNQLRPQPLPSDVIVEMAKRMEPPNPQRNPWEQNSVTLDSEHHFTMEYIQRLVKVISTALENPLSPVQDNAEQKEADRQSCVSSVVHQADRACRRLVSQAMQEAREHQLPPERMRSLAADLNESKTTFLQDLRRQVLQPLTQGDGVEVERVVNGAQGEGVEVERVVNGAQGEGVEVERVVDRTQGEGVEVERVVNGTQGEGVEVERVVNRTQGEGVEVERVVNGTHGEGVEVERVVNGAQGDGVEVERVVNGAVDVFNKEKQEIIARYLPPCDRIK